MSIKKILIWTLPLILSVGAYAGKYLNNPIEVDLNPTDGGPPIISGSMSAARFSDNDVEQIGCRIRARSNGTIQLHCSANDADNNLYWCISSDPNFISAWQGASAYSWIRFRPAPAVTEGGDPILLPNGEPVYICDELLVSGRSYHIPSPANEKGK